MFGIIPFKTNMNEGNTIDNFFNDFFDTDTSLAYNYGKNKFNVDVKENDSEYTVSAELPAVNKEDINLNYKNSYLTISAKKEQKTEDKNERYIKKECSFGQISRSFYFDNIEADKISAKFENGVLNVKLPKKNKDNNFSSKINIQ